MVERWKGDPADKGRGKQRDTGARKVIEWISKAWTVFELNLPVFYRESLARLLALEKHRNFIETNITAGITLYTDHKPGLYENSLSNKGQLSAWRLLETADLLSIVENLYRTGGKMLLADPLFRLCAPSDGFYDVSLPAKVGILLENLPQQVAECKMMRVFANKTRRRSLAFGYRNGGSPQTRSAKANSDPLLSQSRAKMLTLSNRHG
jgi:hypothetical protein